MPPLSKALNCWGCGSPHHHKSVCPRVDRSCPAPKVARVKHAGIPAAEAAAATKKAAARAAAKETRAAKAVAKAAAKDAAKVKRDAQRVALIAQRERVAQEQAVHAAAYAALVGVGVPILTTPGNYRHSTWAVVNNLCDTCNFPPGRCMCIKR